MSLYDRIGGAFTINGAIDSFYEKVAGDERLTPFFEDICMDTQIKKQKTFMTMAFDDDHHYNGQNMRDAHKPLLEKGLSDEHIDIFIEHFKESLREHKVPEHLIEEAANVANSYRDDVLNR